MRTQKASEFPDESNKRLRPPYTSAAANITTQKPRVKMEAHNDKLELLSAFTRHDVRSKLTTIRNMIYLTKIGLTEYPEALDNLNDISRTIEEVENVLTFAQIYEALGIEEPRFERLSDHVNAAIALLPGFRAGASGIRVVDETQGLKVLADSMLRHLFYNLFIFLFIHHVIQNRPVGFNHSFRTNFSNIFHGLFGRYSNNSIGLLDVQTMQSEKGRLDRGAGRRR